MARRAAFEILISSHASGQLAYQKIVTSSLYSICTYISSSSIPRSNDTYHHQCIHFAFPYQTPASPIYTAAETAPRAASLFTSAAVRPFPLKALYTFFSVQNDSKNSTAHNPDPMK